MPHPQGGARVLEWKLRIWLDTRFIIFGDSWVAYVRRLVSPRNEMFRLGRGEGTLTLNGGEW